MAEGAVERRPPRTSVSSSCGLSFLLHGLLVLTVVYGPQWLHGKPFNVPLNYEVTLVAPRETGDTLKSESVPRVGQKAATATAKAVARPKELLALPSLPKSGARSEEMTLPGKRRAAERSPVVPELRPPAPSRIVAPQVAGVPAIGQSAVAQPAAGQGSGAAAETGVTVGNTDPALAYYFVLIQDKITGNWTPPKMSPGTTASVALSMKIQRSGQVRNLSVGSSSGDRMLDDSAVRAVNLSSPLPPLPPLYKAETLSLELRFTFVGEKS